MIDKYTNYIEKPITLSDEVGLASNLFSDWVSFVQRTLNYDSIWTKTVAVVWDELTYNESTIHKIFGYKTSEKEVHRTLEVYVFTLLHNEKFPDYSDTNEARKDPLRAQLINLIVQQTGFEKNQVERILKQLYWCIQQGRLEYDDVLHPRKSKLFPTEYKIGASDVAEKYAGLIVDTAGNVLQAGGNILQSTSGLLLGISNYLPYILIIGGVGIGYFILKKQGII